MISSEVGPNPPVVISKSGDILTSLIKLLEIEDLLVLKNNKGTEDNRVRHMDYGVQFSKIFYLVR